MTEKVRFEWPTIEGRAKAHVDLMRGHGAGAVKGESRNEAHARGMSEGFAAGVVWAMRRLGAVDITDPSNGAHCGFAVGYGPGDSTRRVIAALARKQAEAVKTTVEYELTVWPSPWGDREMTYETVTAALAENGMTEAPR